MSELERNQLGEKSVQPPRRRNSLQEDQLVTKQRTQHGLFNDYKFHLFNCGRTYNLDAVEDLLAATFCFDYAVEKHYFSVDQMHNMMTNIIPTLQMAIAFFVVHAHESRLSINEDNAGNGYTNIYRTLMFATGE